jgi:elongation factor P
MKTACELRARMIVRVEGTPYRVIAADYHGGGGKMGGVTHAKLQSLQTGTLREWRFRGDEPLDEATLERQHLQFLYSDERLCHFMDPQTFDQIDLENDRLGPARAYLTENTDVPVEFLDGVPIGVQLPDVVEARVARTAAPFHAQGTDNVWKDAVLENGVRIKVPPFIAEGELIRVNVDMASYVERAKRR